MQATPTSRPSSSASLISGGPAGLRSNHHSNSSGVMYEPVMRLRALDVGEGADWPPELVLQEQLREDDLARRLVELEVGERLVADPVRLDADPRCLQLRERAPVQR